MLGVRPLVAFLLAALAAPAFAHGGHDHGVGWTLDPWLIVPLGLALALQQL